jgi:endonuclease/exonuclease/phosphatase family metal-dependent hydrolase
VFDPVRVAELGTYPASRPGLKVDHALLFADRDRITMSAETIHAETATSDHLPLSVTLQIAG